MSVLCRILTVQELRSMIIRACRKWIFLILKIVFRWCQCAKDSYAVIITKKSADFQHSSITQYRQMVYQRYMQK